jgi:hypothetical protein
MFTAYPFTKLHTSSSADSLILHIKPKTEENFEAASMQFFTSYKIAR